MPSKANTPHDEDEFCSGVDNLVACCKQDSNEYLERQHRHLQIGSR